MCQEFWAAEHAVAGERGAGCLSLASSMVTLWRGLLLLRFFGYGSLPLVNNNAIAQWFVRRRGFIMGLYSQSLSMSWCSFRGWRRYSPVWWVGAIRGSG
jgi:hypothetical protein